MGAVGNPDRWHYFTVTYDGTTTVIYKDGSQDGTGSGGVTAFDRFKVGANRNTSQHFDGRVDEVRIYGQTLRAEDVGILYQSETSN